MMPFSAETFPPAAAFARREAFRLRRESRVLVDTVRCVFYVLTGAHKQFLIGKPTVLTVSPYGGEELRLDKLCG